MNHARSKDHALGTAAPVRRDRYIADEIEEIRFIHETLYPGRRLDVHLWTGGAPLPTPAVIDEDAGYGPEVVGQNYLGQVIMGDAGSVLPAKRLYLTIPDRPTKGDLAESYMPWAARPRKFRAIFGLSPMLFEHGKYRVERRNAARMQRNHDFRKLTLSHRLSLPGKSALRDTDRAPAILIGFHWLEVGGAEKLAFDTVDWALDAGLRVFVIADRPGLQRSADKLPDDPRVHFLRTDRYLPRGLYPVFIERLIAQQNIVLTHNHHCTVLYECLPAIKANFPAVKNLDSTHIVEHADGGYPRISGVWSNFIDVHHVISADLKRFYNRNFQVPAKTRIGRLLAPEAREMTPDMPSIAAGAKTCRIAFVGRMVHQKRPVVAVRIMQALARWGRSQGIDFRFDIVGEGPYAEAVGYLIRRYRLRDRVQLHAAGADVPAILGKSDVLLVPSANEGLALVCYEAIAAGCVPVASAVGAQHEIVPEETLVPVAPFACVAQSVAVVQRLLTDQDFTDRVTTGMRARYDALRQEPLAREVLDPIYRAAAEGDDSQ